MEHKDQQLVVALRIRPLSDVELQDGATIITHKLGDQVLVLMDPSEDAEDPLRAHRSRERAFIFDTVFDQHASQEEVYRATTQQLIEGVISGYNATVFAYGPSGAGKTHTMLGMDAEPGIYLQTLSDLFQAIEESREGVDYSVSMSYFEIYNEVIRDLLNPSSGCLDLREDAKGSIQVAGVREVSTSNAQEIMQLLTKGNRQRMQESTATNSTSSRSHAVLQVTVHQRSRGVDLAEEVRIGRLFMVDLAGSERAAQTQNRGMRMKEGAHINRSLLALGNCINALSEKSGGRTQFVNFRDSKLTRLLKDALGGNSRTVMIAHISPASTCFEESRTTLLYASRAKNIKTRVKRNLMNVSYRIAQYTDVISRLRREIEHLKSRLEKKSEPAAQDMQVLLVSPDAEEDGRLQMSRIRAQLVGAFREQKEMRSSLVELENASTELHMDMSRHLLTLADWERDRTHLRAHRGHQEPEKDEEPMDGDGGESTEPHEVALAREEVNLLLAEQRKTAALKAELEQRLAQAKQKASQMEQLLPQCVTSEDQREVLRLLCQKDLLLQRYHQHRRLCQQLVEGQRRLLQDHGIPVPEHLDRRYCLFSQELGEGALDRLLLLHSEMASSLRDGSVVGVSPPLGEAAREQPTDLEDLPWAARSELPQELLESHSAGPGSRKATPSKRLGRQDSLLPLPSLLTPPALERPAFLNRKNLVCTLQPAAGPELSASALSAQALQEMAAGTKGIALLAASRRSKAQTQEGGSGRSSRHLLEEAAPEPRDQKPSTSPGLSPAPGRRPRASPCREPSRETDRRKQSACLPWSTQLAAVEQQGEGRPSAVPTRSPGRSFLPPVTVVSRMKPSHSLHADDHTPHVPEVSFTFPSAVWRSSPGSSRVPLLPRDIRGSTDSMGQHHSPLPPSNPRRPQGGSAKTARRLK
ncbi:kinesin-like protein KIF19 [Ochotona princeps]|uniref:kinesin-like protein KIF19 n=1 Tax=Ochotona princeps TaxID=9978 RepID=UPI002714C7F0|nr:kinesin-like protein KIF19 [Ochotona princeps]